jgi:2'-5' RNA ligase
MQIKASDYPEMYQALGIDTGRLGCIMFKTEPIVISDVISEADYYYSDTKSYVKGNVSEDVPHVTLLYGLMRSGVELEQHVRTVLTGWVLGSVKIDRVSFFYGESSEYITIVAMVAVSDELREAHARLSLLPHINTFDEYRPHITLAYVSSSAPWQRYVSELNDLLAGTSITTVSIDLGD